MPNLIYLKDHSAQYVVILLFVFFSFLFFLFLGANFKVVHNENQRVKTTLHLKEAVFLLD